MAKNNFNKFTHADIQRQSARQPAVEGLYETMKAAGIEKRMSSGFTCEEAKKSSEINRPVNESNQRGESNHKHSFLIAVGMAIVGAVAIAINPKWLPGAGALISKSK
ncbi:MAG: hypothetical protein IPP36_01315 [Nitrosomonadales bacterium]|nr:hypothetical protein [Nitrosomonadales bacterium]